MSQGKKSKNRGSKSGLIARTTLISYFRDQKTSRVVSDKSFSQKLEKKGGELQGHPSEKEDSGTEH